MSTLRSLYWAPCIVVGLALLGCQNYPFELREPDRVDARQITEVVAQLTPADILFVIDNSGSMGDEIAELQNNLDLFIDELSASDNDFQVGIITTDMECNIPSNDCMSASPTTSFACCVQRAENPNPNPCVELDQDGDGSVDSSTCDGGRLRSATAAGRRVFSRPAADERIAWASEVRQAIDEARNNLNGSTFEAGLSATVTAVACAVGDPSCSDPAVSQLNTGFIRDEADLVVIFLTDEDDCSVANAQIWDRPPNLSDPADLQTRFCGALDCYAYYAADDLIPPPDGNGINDFVDEGVGGQFSGLVCDGSGEQRTVNPPGLQSTSDLLDALIAVKGGDIGRVRAAGIISGVSDNTSVLGFAANGCFSRTTGPSANCGCLAGSPFDVLCSVTRRNGQTDQRIPVGAGGTASGGCQALPSGRYAQFLEELALRRQDALLASDVLVDSICQNRYDQTLSNIVNNVILSNCFGTREPPAQASDVLVRYNGAELNNVAVGSSEPGWSWVEGRAEICLEGGLSKSINDRVEILLLSP